VFWKKVVFVYAQRFVVGGLMLGVFDVGVGCKWGVAKAEIIRCV
jgi:hypothetical protein